MFLLSTVYSYFAPPKGLSKATQTESEPYNTDLDDIRDGFKAKRQEKERCMTKAFCEETGAKYINGRPTNVSIEKFMAFHTALSSALVELYEAESEAYKKLGEDRKLKSAESIQQTN
jgi:hypothetical protein